MGIESAAGGHAELAVGNIVGTNLVNLLLILGASAAMRSIALGMQTLRIDLPVIAVASILLYVLALDGELTTLDGVILIAYGAAYTVLIILMSRRESSRVVDEFDSKYADHKATHPRSRLLRDIVLLGAGIAIIVGSADLLVDGALQIARSVGISEAVVGLTVIAIGTSAPELVTTLVSTVRDDRDIALGNLFGSSVYNVVFILGLTVLVAPGGVHVPPEVVHVDLPLMTATALLCVPVFVSGRRVSRWEGALFVACYAVYLTYLLVART